MLPEPAYIRDGEYVFTKAQLEEFGAKVIERLRQIPGEATKALDESKKQRPREQP